MAQHGGPVPFSSTCIDSSTVQLQKPSSSSTSASEQGREDRSICNSWFAAQTNANGQAQYPLTNYTKLHQQSNGWSPSSPAVPDCLRPDPIMPFSGWSQVGQPALKQLACGQLPSETLMFSRNPVYTRQHNIAFASKNGSPSTGWMQEGGPNNPVELKYSLSSHQKASSVANSFSVEMEKNSSDYATHRTDRANSMVSTNSVCNRYSPPFQIISNGSTSFTQIQSSNPGETTTQICRPDSNPSACNEELACATESAIDSRKGIFVDTKGQQFSAQVPRGQSQMMVQSLKVIRVPSVNPVNKMCPLPFSVPSKKNVTTTEESSSPVSPLTLCPAKTPHGLLNSFRKETLDGRQSLNGAPVSTISGSFTVKSKQKNLENSTCQNRRPTRKRSASIDELTYVGKFEDAANESPLSRIRVFVNEKGHKFYDCICGNRRAVQDLRKIARHVRSHDVLHHRCRLCGRVFSHHLQLNAHQKIHKRENKLQRK